MTVKRKREIVAILVLPLLYLYIMKLPDVFFLGLLAFAVTMAQAEFYAMYGVQRGLRVFGLFSGLLVIFLFYIGFRDIYLFLIFFFILVLLIKLFTIKDSPEGTLKDISPVVVGFIYVPFILSLLIPVRMVGPEWIIYTGATVWGADSFAYYFGKNLGKKKLFPAVSPKKTVVGAVGSLLGGLVASVVVKMFLIPHMTLISAILSGIIIGSISITGDLSESMFKRDSGVKDSSVLIPGHGGILDKLDGIIFATPVVYIITRFYT